MNKRELKKVLKRHLAGYLLDNQALEEWARLNYQVKIELKSNKKSVVFLVVNE
jgi:hypothetical protein